MVFRTFFFFKSHPHFVMLNLRNIRVTLMITKFEYSHQSLGQEFHCEQVHKFPLEMASPPPYILAVCFENCLRQRRFLRRSQQNGYAAASIFAIPKRFNRNFSQNRKDKYSSNQNFPLAQLLFMLYLY